MKHTPGIRRKRVGLLRSFMLLGLCGCLVATDSRAEDCWRESVNANWPIVEFNSATWGRGMHALRNTEQSWAVLVDMFSRQSLELTLSRDPDSGTTIIQPSSSISRASDLFPEPPSDDGGEPIEELLYGVKRSNGGFIGLNLNASNGVPSAVRWYDASLGLRAGRMLPSRIEASGEPMEENRALSMFDWQPVADRLFAYGALGIAGKLNMVREGFYITQIQTPGNDNVTPMARMVSDLPGHRHYAFHHDFITVVGNIVYFLEMRAFQSLRYYDTRNGVLGRLEGFPGSDQSMPYPLLNTMAGMYKAVERMTIPVGLYSDTEGLLYALLRRPDPRQPEGGVTSWKVVKLQPDFDSGTVKELGAVRLPTHRATRHLYVLPGETTWLVLELESMPPKILKHRLLAAVTIPHTWIAEPDMSPIAEAARTPVACQSAP